MAGIQGGYGTIVKIKITSTLTAIAHALDVEFPEFEKVLADVTAHDSPGGYQEWIATGKRKLGAMKMKLLWDVSEATHAAITAAFNSDLPVEMSVQDPDGDEVITFNAHIQKLGRVAKQEEGYTCDVTIQPTGIPTIGV
jgi:predicted secreted protein